MRADKYQEMAAIEARHWWFRGRRHLMGYVLDQLRLDPTSKLLEVGCGTGGNLAMLQTYGQVDAVEMDDYSREHARGHSGVDVQYGKLPDELPFAAAEFDLVCAFDVLEHLEDDLGALVALQSLLRDGGYLLITVPATKWLYGKHDRSFHHFRRYSLPELRGQLQRAGFNLQFISYFNTLLFPAAVLARVFDPLLGGNSTAGMAVPPAPLNSALYRIFTAERAALRRGLLPFGLSLMALARRP